MQFTDILAQMGGLQSMARELGISDTQAASGAAALVPAILGGFKKQAQSQPGGLEGFGGLLGQLGDGGLLASLLGGQDAGAGNTTPGAPAPGLASMFDLDGDGNPLDDILRMIGQAMR